MCIPGCALPGKNRAVSVASFMPGCLRGRCQMHQGPLFHSGLHPVVRGACPSVFCQAPTDTVLCVTCLGYQQRAPVLSLSDSPCASAVLGFESARTPAEVRRPTLLLLRRCRNQTAIPPSRAGTFCLLLGLGVPAFRVQRFLLSRWPPPAPCSAKEKLWAEWPQSRVQRCVN